MLKAEKTRQICYLRPVQKLLSALGAEDDKSPLL